MRAYALPMHSQPTGGSTRATQLELPFVRTGAAPRPAMRSAAAYSVHVAVPIRTRQRLFRREILPGLLGLPAKTLMDATGLSRRYCLLIRSGRRVPHPKHWDKLREIGRAAGG